ncbi:MAG: hypothetical protein AAGF06_07100 [Pseudomonadota bacterium]
MLVGHFSTALVAHQKVPCGSLLYFLVISQLQDILWSIFHYAGLEVTGPDDVFNATLQSLTVDMLYSHDLLPQLVWMLLAFVIGKALFKSNTVGLVGAMLVLGHFVLDLISGHPHHVFGADSVDISLGLYASNAYLAVLIEAVFTAAMMIYFFRQEARTSVVRTRKNKAAIIALFVFGILYMFSIATISLRDWLSLPEFDLGFATTMPNLIVTYVSLLLILLYLLPKKTNMNT